MVKRRGNNERSIYRRKDGYWVGKYGVQAAKGTRIRYMYGKTRAVVAEKLMCPADRNGGLTYYAGKMTSGSTLGDSSRIR